MAAVDIAVGGSGIDGLVAAALLARGAAGAAR